jgi:hypothetical protein
MEEKASAVTLCRASEATSLLHQKTKKSEKEIRLEDGPSLVVPYRPGVDGQDTCSAELA